MNKKFEDILNECLERMLVKGETLEQCLQSYPEHASELKPLLETALGTRKALDIKPSAEFKARARYQFQAALAETTTKKSRLSFFQLPRWATAVVLVVGLLISGGGTVLAASYSMPDSPLYPVKMVTEEIQLGLPHSDEDRAEMEMEFTNKRVAEIVYLAKKGDAQKIEDLTERLDKRLEKMAGVLAAKKAAKTTETAMLAVPTREVKVPTPVPTPVPAPTDSFGTQKASVPPSLPASVRAGDSEENKDTGGGKVASGKAEQTKLKEEVVRYATSHPAVLKSALEKAPESSKSALQKTINVLKERYEKALEALDD